LNYQLFKIFRKLLEAGVRVTAVRYHGTIHDFGMLNAITE